MYNLLSSREQRMGGVHSILNDYSVQIALFVGLGILYYKFGGGLGRKSRDNYSLLVGDKPRNSSQCIQNYRCKSTGLLTSYNSCKTIYQTFQYVLRSFILASQSLLTFRNTLQKYPDNRYLGTRPLIKIHKEETEVKGEKKTWLYYEMGPYQWYALSPRLILISFPRLTFTQASKKITARGSGLVELGLKRVRRRIEYLSN